MVRLGIFLPGLFLLASRSFAQDLDPRAYMRLPLKTTTAFTGFAYSRGGVVTDPTLPLKKYSGRRSVDFIWCFPSIQFFWSYPAGIVSNSLFLGTSSRRCTATCLPHHPFRFCRYEIQVYRLSSWCARGEFGRSESCSPKDNHRNKSEWSGSNRTIF